MSLQLLDPRVKLLLLIAISTAALIIRLPSALLSLLAAALLIILAGGVKPAVIWVKLRGLFGLIVMIFLLQCLFDRSGEPLLTVSGATLVTDSGFQTALLVNLRLLIIIFSALIVAVGETRDYLLALTQCKVPYEIAFMVLAALRFIPMLREESRDVLCAARMRGLRTRKTGLRSQAAAYLSVVIPIVAGAIRRAEQLSVAMEARGFRAFPRRTSMRSLRMRPADWVYLSVFCALVAAVFVCTYTNIISSLANIITSSGWWLR